MEVGINIEGLNEYKVEEEEEGLYEMDTDSDDSDDSDDSGPGTCDSDYHCKK